MTDKRCKEHPEAEPILKVNPEGSKHYGKWLCSECNKWVNHARRPKTTEKMEHRQKEIRYLLRNNMDRYTDMDLHSLLALYGKVHLGLVDRIKYDEFLLKDHMGM